MSKLEPNSRITIVGAGVFGLSTALWLARSGYQDITVMDMQDTASGGYSPSVIDSASADLNKIIRFSYGAEIDYQRLASQAAVEWEKWNAELTATDARKLPLDLGNGNRRLWWNCGSLRMSATSEFGDFELRTLENLEKDGFRETQFRTDDVTDRQRANLRGWSHKLDPCHRQERFGVNKAVLDSSAGFVVAYKSCVWVKHLAEQSGVKFVLDPLKGKVTSITETSDGSSTARHPVVTTADSRTKVVDLVVVASGGWTPSLLPETSQLMETTAGSVAMIQLPKSRRDLWKRFAPENMPVVTWGMREGKGIYSFPRDENGIIKIGYRKTKFTNFEEVNGRRVSVPKTARVTDKQESNVPMIALEGIKEYISINFPELQQFGISATKLCWYTDSLDNSFVVDYVPGRNGVAVCSGGSGHGFKFLPILGREVVKILEGQGHSTPYGKLWKWRRSTPIKGRNGLDDGEEGPRVMAKHRMASSKDWEFNAKAIL